MKIKYKKNHHTTFLSINNIIIKFIKCNQNQRFEIIIFTIKKIL
jgi:hypothetical protein